MEAGLGASFKIHQWPGVDQFADGDGETACKGESLGQFVSTAGLVSYCVGGRAVALEGQGHVLPLHEALRRILKIYTSSATNAA